MVASLQINTPSNFGNHSLTSPWIDDELTDIIDAMEGYSHHTFQSWIEFVKINQPRPDTRNSQLAAV